MVERPDAEGTWRPGGVGRGVRRCASAIAVGALLIAASRVRAREAPVWTHLELVENTVEGPAYDRCHIEATLEKGQTARWRFFYGEAKAGPGAGWSAVRASSGCAASGAEPPSTTWTLRGSPYFLIDVTLGPASVSGREVVMEAVFSMETLTGFAPDGTPAYATRTGKRTLRLPEGSSAFVPVLLATGKETDEFRVRDLFLRFRVSANGSRPPVEYGELAVAADVPRAEILLDGGPVGRTSVHAPVVLRAVRVGPREVMVRDASAREARAVVRIEKGRRSSVALALMKGSPASADGMRTLGRNRQGGEEFWREKDGAMVVRIPGGEFQMGSPEGEGEPGERPRHAVRVDGFLMDKTEVTWGQYERFLAASPGQPSSKSPIWGMPETLPASSITWPEAAAFCSWVGGRLPTEAEWERAARGDDSRRYPWGNTFDAWRCNTRDGGPHTPTPAGAYPDCVSPYGVLDLAGSVQEWCSDWYDEKYYVSSSSDNPAGPAAGTRRVMRGGGWMNASSLVRTAYRLGVDPGWPGPMIGFRCAQNDRKADEK